jgi:hypothetical protein
MGGWGVVDRIYIPQDRSSVVGACEHGNEHLAKKGGNEKAEKKAN